MPPVVDGEDRDQRHRATETLMAALEEPTWKRWLIMLMLNVLLVFAGFGVAVLAQTQGHAVDGLVPAALAAPVHARHQCVDHGGVAERNPSWRGEGRRQIGIAEAEAGKRS